jgi:class 3 adenylate cyclase
MAIWRFFKRRMAVKVFLGIGLVVGCLLLFQAWTDSQRELRNLRKQSEDSATDIARLFIGAVEHSMLGGAGIDVKSLVAELEERLHEEHQVKRLPEAQVQIFDQRGIEVFAPKPPVPAPEELPPDVAAVLASGQRREAAVGRVYRPVKNEADCYESCHAKENPLRGVIALELDRARCAETRREVLSQVITEGFTHVMTAEREDLLDAYFSALEANAPQVDGVAVFDASAEQNYGAAIMDFDQAGVQALLERDATTTYLPRADGGTLALVPLPMQDRCTGCHKTKIGAMRGVLAVALGPSPTPGGCASDELESVIDTSLRYIMMSRLGRRIADFLDAVAATGVVRELALYDEVGRRYWTTRHPEPPPHVAAVLARGETVVDIIQAADGERVRAVEPLFNERACTRCHGGGSKMRGVVSVSLSTAFAAEMRQATLERRLAFTVATLLGILLLLGVILQYLVARPVQRIGEVAEQVGRGNLAMVIEHADEHGDEIARLGQRVNEMVLQLQAKLHLEKFVSRGAVAAADAAGMRELLRGGERRTVTVLFSDIRGFTSYAERVAPEIVVEMLNRLLQAQADVVGNFGGDIDKFVGDELMAVFQGANAEARAVLCATRMVDAVHRARREGESLSVGVGISCGDVVYGPIGHEDRMDYTVIGDVVNTGARLCSAAAGDEIIVTETVRAAIGDLQDIAFDTAPPLAVKGKREPLRIYRAWRRS